MRSLSNFDASRTSPPYLDSPRSLEACRRQGISPSELVLRPARYFRSLLGPKTPSEILQLHMESYERKRREKLDIVCEERRKVIKEIEEKRGKRDMDREQRGDGNRFIIEHEQRKLELLRAKQEQELRALAEKKRLMDEIQLRNVEKARINQEREEYRKSISSQHQKESEQQRMRENQRQQAIESAREAEQRLLLQSYSQQERSRAKMMKEKEKRRREEARKSEEEAKKRLERSRKMTERILEEQKAAIELRRMEMSQRDAERKIALAAQKRFLAQKHEKNRIEKAQKLSKARENLANLLSSQAKRYEARQELTEKKRREFEREQEERRMEIRLKAEEKQREIERILAQSQEIESLRKQAYLESMEKAEKRKAELDKVALYAKRQRERHEKEREKQRKAVQSRMEAVANQRRSEISSRLQEADMQVMDVKAKYQWMMRLKHEKAVIKRKEREDEVKRVEKIREYHREQTQKRLKADEEKVEKVLEEKRKLMDVRNTIRREMDAEKERLLRDFEASQRSFSSFQKPSLCTQSVTSLRKSVRSVRDTDPFPSAHSARSDVPMKPHQAFKRPFTSGSVSSLKQQKNRVLKEEIEYELRKETERDVILAGEKDAQARTRLEMAFGIERAKACERLERLAGKFDEEIRMKTNGNYA